MTCANCARRFTPHKEVDFLCDDCRKVENIILAQKFPESDKLYELHNSSKGRGVQSFLNWLKASDYTIVKTEDARDRRWYATEKDDEMLMREWWGIDNDELDFELDALYRSLQNKQ